MWMDEKRGEKEICKSDKHMRTHTHGEISPPCWDLHLLSIHWIEWFEKVVRSDLIMMIMIIIVMMIMINLTNGVSRTLLLLLLSLSAVWIYNQLVLYNSATSAPSWPTQTLQQTVRRSISGHRLAKEQTSQQDIKRRICTWCRWWSWRSPTIIKTHTDTDT